MGMLPGVSCLMNIKHAKASGNPTVSQVECRKEELPATSALAPYLTTCNSLVESSVLSDFLRVMFPPSNNYKQDVPPLTELRGPIPNIVQYSISVRYKPRGPRRLSYHSMEWIRLS